MPLFATIEASPRSLISASKPIPSIPSILVASSASSKTTISVSIATSKLDFHLLAIGFFAIHTELVKVGKENEVLPSSVEV